MSTLAATGHESACACCRQEVVSLHERQVRVYELFGRTERVSETRGHRSGFAEHDRLHSTAGIQS